MQSEFEGILWIELQHKLTNERLRFCVCYLPPNNSSRSVNAEEYFNTLMGNIYEFQNRSLITIKQTGGMPFEVYKKLFDSTVWSVISYGAAIWGTKEYSVINTVQNKARRFFLGVGKYSPNTAVNGDMGWVPPHIKQLKTVLSHWFSLNHMGNERVNKQIFQWSQRTSHKHKNWCFQVDTILQKSEISLNADSFYNKTQRQTITERLQDTLFTEYKAGWKSKVDSNTSISKNNGGNKLRYNFTKIRNKLEC